jgi:hypothetical protein
MLRGGMRSMAFRSVVSVLVSFVRSFSTNSRPALRAAACGGRPRPATDHRTAREGLICGGCAAAPRDCPRSAEPFGLPQDNPKCYEPGDDQDDEPRPRAVVSCSASVAVPPPSNKH